MCKSVCEFCDVEHLRDKCERRHSFNNPNMGYENNPFVSDYALHKVDKICAFAKN